METATLAGGCFWCTDAVLRRLKGVNKVTTGYSGGTTKNPTMEEVYRGDTGHVECVQVEFDPSVISYSQLLEVFFHLHDPTVIQQPGTLDAGTEYRSVVFYHSRLQKQIAEETMASITKFGIYKRPIITELVAYETFYPAQESQQSYYEKNSYQPYCQYVIDPKIQKLFSEYHDVLKEEYKGKI